MQKDLAYRLIGGRGTPSLPYQQKSRRPRCRDRGDRIGRKVIARFGATACLGAIVARGALRFRSGWASSSRSRIDGVRAA
jgi:hypothetical protein